MRFTLIPVFAAFAAAVSAHAASDGTTYLPFLHSAAGISMPSHALSLETQPAALYSPDGFRVSAQGEANRIWDDAIYQGALFYGASFYGMGAAVQRVRSNEYIARYGLALGVESIGLSLGVSGESGVRNNSSEDMRAGLLFHPVSHFQLGATVIGLRDSIREYGVGLAMELLPGAALVFDATSEPELKETDVKAGLKLGTKAAGITASYGTADSEQIVKGVSGGGFFRFGKLSTLEVNYQPSPTLAKYVATLTIGF